MILSKYIYVNKYRVLADYKVKVTKSPFMSVLQLAKEEDNSLTPELLYENLMKPLALKACRNLLDRLTLMGYFEKTDEAYQITYFGLNSIDNKDFYDKRTGLLEIWIAEKNKFTQEIVKIKEIQFDNDKNNTTQKIDSTLKDLVDYKNVIKLKNGAFTLDNIELQVKLIEESTEQLTITLKESNYKIELANFLEIRKKDKQKIIESILINEFHSNYLTKENILLKYFNNQDISLVRNLKIEDPIFIETSFNSITIPDIKISPKDLNDAKKWFEAKLKQGINKYFESDEEFNQYENEIANKFLLFKEELLNTVSRQQLIEMFEEEDFYKKAKLETIDYLSY